MIADIRFWEQKASEGHYAIPHFNVWNAEMLMGVIDAAEELRAPIIISFGTGFTGNTSFEDFCYMMESMAKKATVPVILHWDHGRNWTILKNAVDHCMNSVMRDASALPYEENVAEIKRCVDYFHAYNIPVEAELGHVGNETVYEEALAEYAYTDPSQAKDFVERTGCDSLAVAVGNVHGVYSAEPKIRFDIIEAVNKEVSVPLVLHGASGIGDEDIKKAIQCGIAKINIHTELCQAAMEAINEHKDEPFLAVERAVRQAVKERAMYKIKLFGDDGRLMNKVEKKLDVLCLGAAVVDIPLRPVSREVFDIESYPVDNIAMAVGGDAMNESTIISRLGFKTGLMAAIGDDAAGAFILRSCDEDNIDTEGVTIDPNLNTSINIGLVTEDGERTFITNRNGSLWKENIEHVNFDKIKEAKILSLASIFNCPLLDGKTLEKIFSFAKEQGMTITADMIMPRLGETLDDIAGALQYVDYFFPNYDEACLMTGEKDEAKVADKLFSYGIKNVVMKIGTRGCYIRNKDGVMIVPACKGITAVDTIGAGDNFASGFIAALLQGKDIKECGEYANCTAAIAVQHPGATSGVQNRQMVEDMLKKYKEDYK